MDMNDIKEGEWYDAWVLGLSKALVLKKGVKMVFLVGGPDDVEFVAEPRCLRPLPAPAPFIPPEVGDKVVVLRMLFDRFTGAQLPPVWQPRLVTNGATPGYAATASGFFLKEDEEGKTWRRVHPST